MARGLMAANGAIERLKREKAAAEAKLDDTFRFGIKRRLESHASNFDP